MKKKLFIAMPYGTREDRLDHYDEKGIRSTLDFDAIWQGVIQPAIPQEFDYRRADELGQPGIIDKLYIEWLFNADIVIADLTFGNPNVYYELGIRHVFSKKGTVLVAQEGSKLPFNVRNQFVLYYDYFKAPSLPKFHKALGSAIINAYNNSQDSPIHILLPGLNISREESTKDLMREIEELKKENEVLKANLSKFQKTHEEERYLEKVNKTLEKSKLFAFYNQIINKSFNSILLYETLGIKLRKVGLINEAINIFKSALKNIDEDSDILRELGFSYRLLGPDHFDDAQSFFYKSLSLNEQDPELLGMIAGLHKRRGNLEEAKLFYERANILVNDDIYSIINLASLQMIFGESNKSKYNYQKVIYLTEEKIARQDSDYWDFLTRGQAMLVLGLIEDSIKSYGEAMRLNIPIEDLKSEYEQLLFLKSQGISIDNVSKVENLYFANIK